MAGRPRRGLLALLALGRGLGRSLRGGLGFGALGRLRLTLGARLSHGSDLPLTFFPGSTTTDIGRF